MQRFLGSQVAGTLSETLGTEVSVGRVHLGFLNRIIIDDVVILDQQQKEMLKASRLSAKVELLPLTQGRISISTAQIFGAHLQLYRDSLQAPANYQFVIDSLASRDTTESTPLDLRINSFIMRHSSVKYDVLNEEETSGRLNPSHLNLTDISSHIVLKALKEDSLNLNVKKLAFKEQSGLQVNQLTLYMEASPNRAVLEDFMLQLPHSQLKLGTVNALYTLQDGKLQKGSLNYHGTLEESDITFSDITCLAPDIQSITSRLTLTSSFSGTDNSIDIHQLQATSADGNIDIHASGFLHHWDVTPMWQLYLDRLKLSSSSIAFAKEQLQGKDNIPELITRLGNIYLTGEADGEGQAVNAETHLMSDIGSLEATVAIDHQRHFSGHLTSNDLQLGQLLADEQLGETALDVDFDGLLRADNQPEANVSGVVSNFSYRGYLYQNIELEASYLPQEIHGIVSIDDPNVKLDLDGYIIKNGNLSDVLLNANISEFRPSQLNLTQQWKDATFSANLNASFTAANLNDATGTLDISQLSMQSEEARYYLRKLNMTSGYDNDGEHFLTLKSDFADMWLKGVFDYTKLSQSITNMVASYLPTLPGMPPISTTGNDFAFQLELKRTDWLQLLFGVPLQIDNPLLLSGFINDKQKNVSIMGSCPDFTYNEGRYTQAALHIGTTSDTLRCAVDVIKHMDNDVPFALSLRAGAADNKINASLSWDNHDEQRMSGTLNTASHFFLSPDGKQTGVISVLPSQIVLRNADWQIESAEIVYAKNNLSVNHFTVKHGQQHIIIDGKVSDNADDCLTADIVDVDVEYILDLVNFHSVDFGGSASGTATVSSLFTEPQASAHLKVHDFLFEHGPLGILDVQAQWDNQKKTIQINGIANDGPASATLVKGYIDPSDPGYIDLDIQALGTNISFGRTFLSSFADRFEGKAEGSLRLYGPLDNINLVGQLVCDAEVDVRQLNTTYTLRQDTLNFIPDNIELHRCKFTDRDGHIGEINGYLHHRHLTRMTFDINVEAENLLAYDFHDFGSEIFYGTVYGTGNVTIEGRPGRITFNIDATPEENTLFVYNVSSPDAITSHEFIEWTVPQTSIDGSTNRNKRNEDTSGGGPTTDLFLNFLVRCTPNATMRLLMDAKMGDYITLNGSGTVRANYYNKGGMQMFGTYTVSQGTYNVTIQELIKKNFTFSEGGTIVFGGAPFDAQLNLQAQHTVNGVSLSDLNVGRTLTNNTVRITCLMNITGQAQAPQVDFDLAMPTVSADEQQMVRSVINGQQEMNQQVLYLLGIGRFYPQTGNNATAEGQTQQSQTALAMQSLLSGTLSSQINSLLKNVVNNKNWNFGANISTGDEGWNNAEYEGLVSGRLLNNRLLLNGQFGYRDRSTTATTSFIGDFDVQYLLTPSGSVAIKMYNQTNDRYFTRSSLNTQGLGFILKKDFSSFPDLFGIQHRDSTVNRR
ncbi:MAG: translocation/assembly module TamB domain-containing protein [Prevotella sp.]|nr:translocation/assembly module TamB domain-containing protein [Prevotella sp.]